MNIVKLQDIKSTHRNPLHTIFTSEETGNTDATEKINTQKSLAFLYTNNEKTEKLRKQFHSPLQ